LKLYQILTRSFQAVVTFYPKDTLTVLEVKDHGQIKCHQHLITFRASITHIHTEPNFWSVFFSFFCANRRTHRQPQTDIDLWTDATKTILTTRLPSHLRLTGDHPRMRAFSHAWLLSVTWQRWRLH